MPTSQGRSPRGRKNRQRDAGATAHKQAERDKQARLQAAKEQQRRDRRP